MFWTLESGPERQAAKAEYERSHPLDEDATYLIKSYMDKACMVRLKGYRGEFVGEKLYLVSPSGLREFIPRDLLPSLFRITVKNVQKKEARLNQADLGGPQYHPTTNQPGDSPIEISGAEKE